MLSDKQLAQSISALMLEYGARLDQSLLQVRDHSSPDEFAAYRRAVGEVLGVMLQEIMNPLYRAHPELKPKELD